MRPLMGTCDPRATKATGHGRRVAAGSRPVSESAVRLASGMPVAPAVVSALGWHWVMHTSVGSGLPARLFRSEGASRCHTTSLLAHSPARAGMGHASGVGCRWWLASACLWAGTGWVVRTSVGSGLPARLFCGESLSYQRHYRLAHGRLIGPGQHRACQWRRLSVVAALGWHWVVRTSIG